MNILHSCFQFRQKVEIFNGGRDSVFLFVVHLPHYFPQILAWSCFRQPLDHITIFKTSNRTNKLSDQSYRIFLHLFLRIILQKCSFNRHKSSWYFPFDLIDSTNHNYFCYLLMFHKNFFHFPRGHSVTCSIDNIIFPRHEVEIVVFISITCVACVVVVGMSWEVFLYVFVIVVEDGQHEWWGKRMFDIESAYLSRLAFFACIWVDNFDITARKRFASWPRSLSKRFPPHIVRQNRCSSLSLPIVIINQLSFEMFPHPLKSMRIASLTYNWYCFEGR